MTQVGGIRWLDKLVGGLIGRSQGDDSADAVIPPMTGGIQSQGGEGLKNQDALYLG
jgi:hypothetical protein